MTDPNNGWDGPPGHREPSVRKWDDPCSVPLEPGDATQFAKFVASNLADPLVMEVLRRLTADDSAATLALSRTFTGRDVTVSCTMTIGRRQPTKDDTSNMEVRIVTGVYVTFFHSALKAEPEITALNGFSISNAGTDTVLRYTS